MIVPPPFLFSNPRPISSGGGRTGHDTTTRVDWFFGIILILFFASMLIILSGVLYCAAHDSFHKINLTPQELTITNRVEY